MFIDDRRPVGDWLSENYIDNHLFWAVFLGWQMVGDDRRLVVRAVLSARCLKCSIHNHRQPNKAAIQNDYCDTTRYEDIV